MYSGNLIICSSFASSARRSYAALTSGGASAHILEIAFDIAACAGRGSPGREGGIDLLISDLNKIHAFGGRGGCFTGLLPELGLSFERGISVYDSCNAATADTGNATKFARMKSLSSGFGSRVTRHNKRHMGTYKPRIEFGTSYRTRTPNKNADG